MSFPGLAPRLVAASLVASVIAAPVSGQTLGAVEQRLSKLEGTMVSVERKLGKRGEGSLDAGASNREARAAASVSEELSRRLDALERQLALMVSQSEESGFASRRFGDDTAKLKADTDLRLVAVEEQLASLSAGLKAIQSRRDTPPAASAGPTLLPTLVDPIEADFAVARGYADAGEWNKAEFAFSAFLATHASHVRAPQARYWQGRSFAAQGRAGDAAKAFLDVFQTWPKDPVVVESLFGLGAALLKMAPPNPAQACSVFDQIEALLAGAASPAQVAALRDSRIEANCQSN